MRWYAAVGAVTLAIGLPQAAQGQFVQSDNVAFEALNQDMWGGSGPGSISYNAFLGATWNVNAGVNAIAGSSSTTIVPGGCLFGACWDPVTADTRTGASFNAHTDGRIGVQLGAYVSTGRLDVSMPGQASLTTSGMGGVSGDVYTIGTGFAVDPTASLSTQFPTLEMFADFVFDVNATGTATGCIIGAGCSSATGTFMNVNETLELASVNRNGSGEVRVLGIDTGLLPVTGSVGPVNYTISPPNLETTASAASTSLNSDGEVQVLDLGVDVPNLVANAILPGSGFLLSGDLLGVGYTVLGTSLGPRFGIGQQFTFTSTPMTTLHFSEAVNPIVGGVTMAATTSFNAPLGSDVDFLFPEAASLEVTPTYWLDNDIRVDTDLLTRLGFSVDILGLDLGPLGSLGPLYHGDVQTNPLSIGLDDRHFAMAFNEVDGTAFTIMNVPEPAAYLLILTGLLAMCFAQRRRSWLENEVA